MSGALPRVCCPPLMVFPNGKGRVLAILPPKYWNKSRPCEFAAASALAKEIAKAVLPPITLKFFDPSISCRTLSISS